MVRRIRWQILIAVLTALLVFGLLGSAALSTAASTEPLSGKIYVEGVVGAPRQLNPLAQSAGASPAERDLAALLFAGLTRIGPDGRVQPDLAARWTVSDDGTVYTFTLADRAWHDGAPVTVDDVLYTVRSVQNANFPGDPALATLWRNVLVSKIDERTVRFELSMPFAPFPSVARLPILPAHLLRSLRPEQWDTAPFSLRPVGAGPYRLLALDSQQAVLVPHQLGTQASVDHLVFRFYPTVESALLALSRHEVQGVASVPAAGRRAPDPPRRTQRIAAPLADYTLLAFNLTQAPLDDPQLRRALALGINRELLIDAVLGGQGQRIDTPILPGTWAAASDAELPAFRRSAAQQALGELGYVDGDGDGWVEAEGERLVLPLLIPDTTDAGAIAAELSRQLREIGVGLDVQRLPAIDVQTALAAHSFTLAVHSWSGVGADPDAFALWHSSRADGGANYAGLRDDQIDQLLVSGRETSDPDERARIYAEFARRWAELIPSLPLYQSVLTYDIDEAIGVEQPAPPLLTSRADRFSLLDSWTIPER